MTPTQLVWQVDARDPIVRRLHCDFAVLPVEVVERCVGDVWLRARHLGIDVSPRLVENIAREQLLCRIKSEPPSGG
jgi:hypothetical protein